MRSANLLYIFGLCIFFGFSCNKAHVDELEVMIIGTDPCTSSYLTDNSNKGYIIRLSNLDTVTTYNLPLSVAKEVEKFQNYKNSAFFIKGFKTALTYRFARDEEKVFPLCLANIDLSDFSQTVQQRQIVIIPRQL